MLSYIGGQAPWTSTSCSSWSSPKSFQSIDFFRNMNPTAMADLRKPLSRLSLVGSEVDAYIFGCHVCEDRHFEDVSCSSTSRRFGHCRRMTSAASSSSSKSSSTLPPNGVGCQNVHFFHPTTKVDQRILLPLFIFNVLPPTIKVALKGNDIIRWSLKPFFSHRC